MADVVEDSGTDVVEDPRSAAEGQFEQAINASPQENVESSEGVGQFDEAFLGRAETYGLSKEALGHLDRSSAESMFAAFDRRLLQSVPADAGAGNRPAPAPVAQTEPQQTTAQALKAFEVALDAEDVGEPVVNAFKGLQEHLKNAQSHYDGRFGELSQKLQQMEAWAQQVNALSQVAQFDKFVNGLGDEWKDVMGKGDTLELDPKSKVFATRSEVLRSAIALGDAYRNRWGTELPQGELFRRALNALHSEKIAERERGKLSGKLKERARGHTERPTRQSPAALSPIEQAKRTLSQGLRKIQNF